MRSLRAAACLSLAAVALACAPKATAAVVTAGASVMVTAPPTRAVMSSAIPSGGPVVVELAEHFFHRSLIVAPVGTTVTWRNVGIQSHDVHARDGTFNSPLLEPGGTFTHTFTTPGTYMYYCAPHEGDGMTGAIEIR